MSESLSRIISKLILPEKPRNRVAAYALATLLPLVSLFISIWMVEYSQAPLFPLFTISVIAAAVYGGWRAGLLSTVISGLLNALALPPTFSLRILDSDSLIRLALFCFGGLMISGFVAVVESFQQRIDFQRERFRVTLSSIGDAVVATDAEGRVTFLNPVAEQTMGWTIAEAAGRPLEEVFHIVNESSRKRVENPVRKVIELGRIVGLANHTVLIRRDGSEIPIDDSAAPIRDAASQIVGAVLVFRDITEQKKRDAALIQSEKLASVGRLAATIAHEINNPLEAMSNLLFLIRNATERGEVEQYALRAEHELNRASEVTKQTLAFVRRDSNPELVSVPELIDNVLSLHSNKIKGKNVRVERKQEAQVKVFGTKSEIRQVLSNLIGNSLDALPENGSLRIRVGLSRVNGQSAARIVVADNGEGIAAEHMAKVFDAFFTTKREVGTGLGLWITKQIVEARGGSIQIRSREGRGTVVRTCWPVEASETGDRRAAQVSN